MKKIKRGSVNAESLSSQSYLYRLGYVWLNVLMSDDGFDMSINPLTWSIIDVTRIVLLIPCALIFVIVKVMSCWFEAYRMKDVKPLSFNWGGRDGVETSTKYTIKNVWYYDNGKINTR